MKSLEEKQVGLEHTPCSLTPASALLPPLGFICQFLDKAVPGEREPALGRRC